MSKAKLFLLALSALGLILASCVQVAGDEVGVRVFNLYQGVEKKAKKTGTYLYLPGIFDFYIFPKTQQKLEMVESEEILEIPAEQNMAMPQAQAKQSLELEMTKVEEQMQKIQEVRVIPHKRAEGRNNIRLKSADGNDIWVDVTVTYQIIENLAPILLQKVGRNLSDLERLVGVETRGVVRQVLGTLETRDFYQSVAREQKLEEAFNLLNQKLNPLGIKINSLNINQFRFLPEYEDLLRERALADQKRQEYEELTLAGEMEREAKIAKAKGDADAMRALSDGIKQRRKLEGEAELYSKKQEALASESKLLNEAEGLKQLVWSLSGPGGDNLVATELAKSLQGKKIILIPGEGNSINLLNLNELMEKYGSLKFLEEKTETGGEKK